MSEVTRQQLLNNLNLVKPGLASKEIIEQSASFVFSEGRVFTYNDEIAVSHPVEGELTGAVKAEELLAFLNKVKDEKLTIEVTENEFRLSGKRAKTGIVLQADIKLPLSELNSQLKQVDWHPLPDGFLAGVKFCGFSASKDMTRPVLTCLHLVDQMIESCDNFRLTRYFLGGEVKFPHPVLLPRVSAKHLKDYEPVNFCTGPGWLHFRNKDNTVFSCRTFEDTYPDLSAYMEVEGEVVTLPEGMKEMLDRAGIFAEAEFTHDEHVDITLDGKFIIVRAQGSAGWFEEKARADFSKGPITFQVNPNFLEEALNLTKEVIVGDGRLKFEAPQFQHVLTLPVTQGE